MVVTSRPATRDTGVVQERAALSIDQNCARAALAQSATKLRAVQIEIVAQDVKYRLIRRPTNRR